MNPIGGYFDGLIWIVGGDFGRSLEKDINVKNVTIVYGSNALTSRFHKTSFWKSFLPFLRKVHLCHILCWETSILVLFPQGAKKRVKCPFHSYEMRENEKMQKCKNRQKSVMVDPSDIGILREGINVKDVTIIYGPNANSCLFFRFHSRFGSSLGLRYRLRLFQGISGFSSWPLVLSGRCVEYHISRGNNVLTRPRMFS